MDTENFDAIKDQLQKVRSHFSEKAEEARKSLASLDFDVARIDSAIDALTGTPPNGKPNGKRKLTKPSASKSQVTDFIAEALSEDKVLAEEVLKERVEKLLGDSGYSLIGFALRFKEACRNSQFVDTPAGIRLKDEQQLSTNGSLITKGTTTSRTTGSSNAGTSHEASHTKSNKQVG